MNNYVNDFNETVRYYYEQLKKCKPLPRKEERELIKKAKNGDILAQNKVLTANLRLVIDTAKKYRGRGVSMDDLIAEGNMGIVKAMQKFDMNYKNKFCTYATWWIRQSIMDFIESTNIRKNFEKSGDETDSPLENISFPYDEEDEIVKHNENLLPFEEGKMEEERGKRQEKAAMILDKLMVHLNDREKMVIEKYYGLKGNKAMNLESIGEIMGNLSKERIRQIKKNAMYKIKSAAIVF